MKIYLGGPLEVEDTWREKTVEKLEKIGFKAIDPVRSEKIKKIRGVVTSDVPSAAIVARNINDLMQVKLSGGLALFNLSTTKEGRRPIGSLFEIQWCVDHEVSAICVTGRDCDPDIRNHPWIDKHAAYKASSLTDAINFIEVYFSEES